MSHEWNPTNGDTKPKYSSRVLVIDDAQATHDAFRMTLDPPQKEEVEEPVGTDILGQPLVRSKSRYSYKFNIDSAYQGIQGCQMVHAAVEEGDPYTVAYVDMRMPPGWDGLETAEYLWEIDPELHIVICSTYTDYTWERIIQKLGINDKLLLLKKPLEAAEVCQLAVALSQKRALAKQAGIKLAEIQELAEVRADALRELSDRAVSMRREKEELFHAVNAMEQVLGVIGHELRTPLTAVRLSADYLNTQQHLLDETLSPFADTIQREAIRMSELIDSMLEAARINSGSAKWNWSRFDVCDAVHEAVDCCRPAFEEKSLPLSLEMPEESLMMNGDKSAIFRLMVNLLTNACKYTPEGHVDASVSMVDEGVNRGRIVLRVQDTGEGISPEVASRIGRAFALNRGVVGSASVKGTGLGLAICTGIAAVHGGRVTLQSKPEEGSIFSVYLDPELDGPSASESQGIIAGP